jgi:hypothetical protein
VAAAASHTPPASPRIVFALCDRRRRRRPGLDVGPNGRGVAIGARATRLTASFAASASLSSSLVPADDGRVSIRISLRWERGEAEKRKDGEGGSERRDWRGRVCVVGPERKLRGREKEEARRTRLRLACQTLSLFHALLARSHSEPSFPLEKGGECERGGIQAATGGSVSPERQRENGL